MDHLSSFYESFDSIDLDDISETTPMHSSEYNLLMEGLLIHYLKYKISLVQLEDLAKLLNMVPNNSVKLPTTKYLLAKEFFSLCSLECNRYVKCTNCKEQNKTNVFTNDPCVCGVTTKLSENNHFIVFRIEQQLKKIVCDNYDMIISYLNEEHSNDCITDLKNGIFDELKKKYRHFFSITINTDGVSLQKSNTLSLWPIQLICNFLPPEYRYNCNNIIVAGPRG